LSKTGSAMYNRLHTCANASKRMHTCARPRTHSFGHYSKPEECASEQTIKALLASWLKRPMIGKCVPNGGRILRIVLSSQLQVILAATSLSHRSIASFFLTGNKCQQHYSLTGRTVGLCSVSLGNTQPCQVQGGCETSWVFHTSLWVSRDLGR